MKEDEGMEEKHPHPWIIHTGHLPACRYFARIDQAKMEVWGSALTRSGRILWAAEVKCSPLARHVVLIRVCVA
jgi:hypothetical protein